MLQNIIFSARENFSLFRSPTSSSLSLPPSFQKDTEREKYRKREKRRPPSSPFPFLRALSRAEPDAPRRYSSCRLSNSTRDLA